MNWRIIDQRETQYHIEPKYKLCISKAFTTGWYKTSFILGILFLLAALVMLILYWTDTIILPVGSLWVVYVIGILALGAMIFILNKPSGLLVNNTNWVDRVKFDRAVAAGTEDKEFFTRMWT